MIGRTFIIPMLQVLLLANIIPRVMSDTSAMWGETLYNYYNQTAYIHLNTNITGTTNDLLIPFYFNQVFNNGDQVSTGGFIEAPASDVKIVTNNNQIYAFYSDEDSLMVVSQYNKTSNDWDELDLVTQVPFYQGSSYLSTIDDTDSVYIFGGQDTTDDNSISARLLRFSISKLDFFNTTTSILPTGFYDGSNILINYNTQAIIGGKAEAGWVSLKQLALWQYEAWAFQSVAVQAEESNTINSRKSPLLLPKFTYSGVNNVSDFSVSSILMIGGELSETSYSSPNFALMDISASSWTWESLDTSVSLINSKTNNHLDEALSLDTIIGAVSIYDTLITINDGSSSSSTKKRDSIFPNYKISLYNSSNFANIDTIDYTAYITKPTSEKSNKSLIIALSVIIPLLFIVIVAIGGFILYKRYKKKQIEEQNEKDLKNIMEFYKTGAKNNNSSVSSFGMSEKGTSSHHTNNNNNNPHHHNQNNNSGNANLSSNGSYLSNPYDEDYSDQYSHGTQVDVKINDYEDGDNLSIGSWRRKRELYEKQRKNLFSLSPKKPTFKSNPRDVDLEHQNNGPDGTVEAVGALTTSGSMNASPGQAHTPSFLKRSLSTVSSHLKRNFSIQSSIKTFMTADTTPEEQTNAQQMQQSPVVNKFGRTKSVYQTIPEEKDKIDEEDEDDFSFHPPVTANGLGIGKVYEGSILGGGSKSTLYLIPEDNDLDLAKPQLLGSVHSLTSESTVHNNELQASPMSPPKTPRANATSRKSKTMFDPFDDEFVDPAFDVQVLVSSKRRSKLRIANPDPETIDEANHTDIVDMYNASYGQSEAQIDPFVSAPSSPIKSTLRTSTDEVRKRVISDESKHQNQDE